MRVAVVAPSPVPLRSGGAERLWTGLAGHLDRQGHSVETIKLPVREHSLPDLVAAYQQFADLDLSHVDLVLTGKYPAWMIDHPNHVVYMLHPLRGLYDRYPEAHLIDARIPDHPALTRVLEIVEGSGRDPQLDLIGAELAAAAADLGPGADAFAIPGPLARSVVQFLDRVALHPRRIRRYFAISHRVAERAGYFPEGVDVGVVYPPPGLDPGPSDCPSTGDIELLSVGRLEPVKRHDLVIAAMTHVRSDRVRLSIVGEGPERPRLEDQAAGDDRVTVEGPLGDDALTDRYRRASAVVVLPEDEDLGYVALEAMLAARPVLTCDDSGGIAELVGEDERGLQVAPTPEAVATAIDRLADDRELAARLGRAGRDFAAGITWDIVTSELLAPPSGAASGRADRRIAMLSTYPVLEGLGGGSRRASALADALASTARVDIVSLGSDATSVAEVTSAERPITEVVVPRSARHRDAETELRGLSGVASVTDMAAAVLWRASPQLVREIRASCAVADVIVLAHPYLVEAARELAPGVPIVYDAHNYELALKDQILPDDEAGDWWRSQVERVETTAVRESVLVSTPTQADREAFAAIAGTDRDIVVVPNGADLSRLTFTTGPERVRATGRLLERLGRPVGAAGVAIFVGSGHPPNLAAADRIIQLAPRMPNVEFLVVGRCGEVLDPTTIPENVTITGTVDDDELAEILAGATIALNPVTEGGGSNLKVIEALASGLPVVTTPVGARGVPGDLVSIAGRGGMRVVIDQVLSNPEAAEARMERARRWVGESVDWSVLTEPFVAAVKASVWP